MYRFICSFLLFLLFAAMFYVVALFAMPHALKKNLQYKKDSFQNLNYTIQSLDTINQCSILFIGSSHCYRGFDTRIFDSAGLRSLNLGSTSQTPIQTQMLLDKYLERINPALVIYEVNPIAFSNEGVESSLDFINNTDISVATAIMAFKVKDIRAGKRLLFER